MRTEVAIITSLLISTAMPAFAADDEAFPPHTALNALPCLTAESLPLRPTGRDLFPSSVGLDPYEAFLRTESVLRHFEVPEGRDSQPLLDHLHGGNSWDGIDRMLSYLDPRQKLGRYTSGLHGALFEVFQDPGSLRVRDFRLEVAPAPPRTPEAAGAGHGDLPLGGLRVALDPGHMGGNEWDRITGKYVVDRRGRKLSEGVMALQVSRLLAAELRALGAEVLLTRDSLAPVTDQGYCEFDLTPYARHELGASRVESWFRRLLAEAPAGERLYRAFESSRDVRRLYSERKRWWYFIHKADLWERSRRIRAFDPDVTLVIHFDAHTRGPHRRTPHATKVYIPGGFLPGELATREDRRYFAEHLMDRAGWERSRRLGRSLVHSLRDRLGLELQRSHGPNATKVENGVFTRNLYLTRTVPRSSLAYLETLFYNHPDEFEALLDRRHPFEIDGRNYPYSDRLREIVTALKEGLVSFAQSSL